MTSDIVRKMDQYIRWKLAKKIGKIILLYLSISLDYKHSLKYLILTLREWV